MGRFQGLKDIPLNAKGKQQALDLVPLMEQRGIRIIYASPLQRAFETAKIVSIPFNTPVVLEPGLREAHVGTATGLLMEEIIQQFGEPSLSRWRSNDPQDDVFGFPEGETKREVRERAMRTLIQIHERTPGHDIIGIATHGFWLKQVMIGLQAESPHGLKNGEIVHLKYDTQKATWYFVERVAY